MVSLSFSRLRADCQERFVAVFLENLPKIVDRWLPFPTIIRSAQVRSSNCFDGFVYSCVNKLPFEYLIVHEIVRRSYGMEKEHSF